MVHPLTKEIIQELEDYTHNIEGKVNAAVDNYEIDAYRLKLILKELLEAQHDVFAGVVDKLLKILEVGLDQI